MKQLLIIAILGIVLIGCGENLVEHQKNVTDDMLLRKAYQCGYAQGRNSGLRYCIDQNDELLESRRIIDSVEFNSIIQPNP